MDIPRARRSPSSRRAWIEIVHLSFARRPQGVALLAEGVDRNKIIKASDGTVLALTEDVTYIKKADNGCYILCPEPDASGISYAGTPYHLFGRKPLDDAESVILEPTDIGGWIMGAKAAIEDADEMNVDQAYRLTLLELNVSDTDDTENT